MKKETKTKKMTIDGLAVLMKAGFRGVNRGVNKKINNVTDLIDKLAASTLNGFNSIEARMATKDDIEGLKDQIQGVDKRIDDFVVTRVKYEDHNKLKARVDFVEKKLEINPK